MEKWLDFYKTFFDNSDKAKSFVESCEMKTPPNNVAKIMMHQTQRLISLSDDLPKIRPQREALQLIFVMICVEHIAKLHDGFSGEGQSRAYVRKFFNEFILETDKNKLEAGFFGIDTRPLSIQDIVNQLYDVRCDVIHEGNYWNFSFYDGKTPLLTGDPLIIVKIIFSEFRDIVVRGCIKAIQNKL
jgi:hypothetical protein